MLTKPVLDMRGTRRGGNRTMRCTKRTNCGVSGGATKSASSIQQREPLTVGFDERDPGIWLLPINTYRWEQNLAPRSKGFRTPTLISSGLVSQRDRWLLTQLSEPPMVITYNLGTFCDGVTDSSSWNRGTAGITQEQIVAVDQDIA